VKRFCFLGIFLLITLTVNQAAGLYVSDSLKVTMRTGPGVEHKIIAMVVSGQEVKKLRSQSGWTQVRLSDGKVGWILDRFLIPEEPSRLALEKLRKKHDALQVKTAPLLKENKNLTKKNKELNSQLAEVTKKAEKLNKELIDLKQSRALYWFFLGTGVLLLGFLIGFLSRRPQRRSYLL